MDKTNLDFKHMLGKARDAAAGGINAMSTGETLAAALVLNRPDWLAAMNYTIAEAIDCIGPEWANLVPAVAKEFDRDVQEAAYATAECARSAKLDQLAGQQRADGELDFSAKLVTYGDAPGYRDEPDARPRADRRRSRADHSRMHSLERERRRSGCRPHQARA